VRPSMIASRSSRRTCSVMDTRSTLERRQVFARGATGLLRWTVDNHTIWCCRGSRAAWCLGASELGAGWVRAFVAAGPVSTGDPATRPPGTPCAVRAGFLPSGGGAPDDHAAQHAPSRHPRVKRPPLTMLRSRPLSAGVRDRPPRGTSPPRSWHRAVLPYRKAARLAGDVTAVAVHGS